MDLFRVRQQKSDAKVPAYQWPSFKWIPVLIIVTLWNFSLAPTTNELLAGQQLTPNKFANSNDIDVFDTATLLSHGPSVAPPSLDPMIDPGQSPSQNPLSVSAPTDGPINGPNRFELLVPFYIYENPELNWENATVDRNPYIPPEPTPNGSNGKHSDDYFLLRAALKHPMRTYDPEQAQLFFVPSLLNAVLLLVAQWEHRQGETFCTSRDNNGTEVNCFDKSDQFRLLNQVNHSLTESPWFQRSSGKDHLIVASHWHARSLAPDLGAIHMCNSLIFERELPHLCPYDRIRMPGMYIGRACPPVAPKRHDFAMIASTHNDSDHPGKRNAFQSRRDICDWLGSSHQRNVSVAACGGGTQCPALAQARLGFHVRGDTWGSNRLMDTIMSETIPLFTNEEQYRILPSFYPWKEVSYFVNVTDQGAFFASIDDIMSRPESEYLEKMRLIKENMHILDHRQPYQFDRHMADLARRLDLQT
jgi:Exostosin family